MSDERAIEAVTKTLSGLILRGLSGVSGAVVDTKPLNELTAGTQDKLINLYLYQADVDGSLRNEDRLDLAPGETGEPPFSLVLHYLITPFVRHDPALEAHRLLGSAIRILHDNPVLQRRELAEFAPDSNVSQQLDRIRITWQPFGEKDIYSLWSAFQTPYRMSVAYQVGAVLIDSHRSPRTPVPVLKRGRQDEGPVARGDVQPPFPELTAAVPANKQPAARLGDRVALRGSNLAAQSVQARLVHPLLHDPVLLNIPTNDVTSNEVGLTLDPATAGRYAAGLWSVGLALTDEIMVGTEPAQVTTITNEVPLVVAPLITNLPTQVNRDVNGDVVIQLRFAPAPLPGQQVVLLLDGRAVAPDSPTSGDNPRFTVTGVKPGRHLVRLRVAGVDSLLVDRSGDRPRFDPSQAVTVT